MLFDLAAWVVILLVAWVVGAGVLALLHGGALRRGDAFVIATWLGVIVLALTLLATSLVTALTPVVGLAVALGLIALGTLARARATRTFGPSPTVWSIGVRPTLVVGTVILFVGAAALTSDAVTLYDSLVYHVGVMRWLREHGTVPGVALIHNRLGHVSAWFALAAPFDAGFAAARSATVPLGVALVLVGVQTAIAIGRAVARRAWVADWFIIVVAVALIWAVNVRGAATPSPDLPANVLIVVSAWSMLVVSQSVAARTAARGMSPDGPGANVVPLALSLGAASMKLFAIPAAVAAAAFFVARSRRLANGRSIVQPLVIAALVTAGILGPFIAASVTATGCPAYPSAIGCTRLPWSVGPTDAAAYAEYIRDVARWDRRGNIPPNDPTGWIGPWIGAHPVVTLLAVLSPVIAIVLLRHVRRDGERFAPAPHVSAPHAIVAVALSSIAFAAWQAPAPRFLFAVVLMIPALATAYWLYATASTTTDHVRAASTASRFHAGFATAAAMIGLAYGVASQKLNIRTALTQRGPFLHVAASELLLPAAPPAQPKLYRWRVNDLDVLTPVPRPVADTLSYQSVIAHNAEFEKCSSAPLPCTPYIPGSDVRLRRPSVGAGGGFVRGTEQDYAGRFATCVGEFTFRPTDHSTGSLAPAKVEDPAHCGPVETGSHRQ